MRRELLEAALKSASAQTRLRKMALLLLDYVELLSAELDDTAQIAAIHGWKSSRVEEGKRLRRDLGIEEELWNQKPEP